MVLMRFRIIMQHQKVRSCPQKKRPRGAVFVRFAERFLGFQRVDRDCNIGIGFRAENEFRRLRVNVFVVLERFEHYFVLRDVRQKS